VRLLSALIAAGFLAATLSGQAPLYTAAGLVNSADNQSGALSPNAIATLYGQNLAWGTKALTANDIGGGVLPLVLPNTGVTITVGGITANPLYVSPTQINFLVPVCLLPGTVNVQVVVDGWAGPSVLVQLAAASPALFQLDQQTAVATSANGTVLTGAAPAHPGDLVILYATGLGQTKPALVYRQLPTTAAPLARLTDFSIQLDGVPVDPSSIAYAGVAPGFAGLYQINVTLPAGTGTNPEIRIALGDAVSAAGIHLPVAAAGS
jgi:uncharacterized protein (TIGR03437 family)